MSPKSWIQENSIFDQHLPIAFPEIKNSESSLREVSESRQSMFDGPKTSWQEDRRQRTCLNDHPKSRYIICHPIVRTSSCRDKNSQSRSHSASRACRATVESDLTLKTPRRHTSRSATPSPSPGLNLSPRSTQSPQLLPSPCSAQPPPTRHYSEPLKDPIRALQPNMPVGNESTSEKPTVNGNDNNEDVRDEDEDGIWETDDDANLRVNNNPQTEGKHSGLTDPNSWDVAHMPFTSFETLQSSDKHDGLDEFVGAPTSMTDFQDHVLPELCPPMGTGFDETSRPVQRSRLLGFLGRFGASNMRNEMV